LPAPFVNGREDETAFENGRISNFEGLMTLTLTVDQVILHTVVHRSSTSTYMQNLTKIEETFVDGRIHIRTFEIGFIMSTLLQTRPKYIFNKTRHNHT